MSANKLERLLDLTAALLATERVLSAEELWRRVPGYAKDKRSFRRAFERDKEELRERHLPLVIETVPGSNPPIDGYRIDRDRYYLADPGLEADELAALHLAANAVRVDGDTGRGALRKLGGVIEVGDNADLLTEMPASPLLGPMFEAITERCVVRFGYRGEDRAVEPRRLDFQRGRWYLTGFDRLREGERNFRIDRIEGDITLDGPGSAPAMAPGDPAWTHPWELGDDSSTRALVLVDADQVVTVVHQLGSAAIVERRSDGSAVFELQVRERGAFRSFVLDLLEHGEVLEPTELRDDVVQWLTALKQ